MGIYSAIFDLMPVIYPKFYTVHNAFKNELVFLDDGEPKVPKVDTADKTQCEAFINHYHLFDKVGKRNYKKVVEIGMAIANNLRDSLLRAFPNKFFVVYLEVNVNDSVMLRFHQIWEDEPPYFDTTQAYDDVEIFEIR